MKEFFVRSFGTIREDGEMYEVCVFADGAARVIKTVTGPRAAALAMRDQAARKAGTTVLTTPSLPMARWMDAGGRGASEVMKSIEVEYEVYSGKLHGDVEPQDAE